MTRVRKQRWPSFQKGSLQTLAVSPLPSAAGKTGSVCGAVVLDIPPIARMVGDGGCAPYPSPAVTTESGRARARLYHVSILVKPRIFMCALDILILSRSWTAGQRAWSREKDLLRSAAAPRCRWFERACRALVPTPRACCSVHPPYSCMPEFLSRLRALISCSSSDDDVSATP